MEPRIETLPEKTLVGLRRRMTVADDMTLKLWQTFMPRRTDVQHRTDDRFYSLKFFDADTSFSTFTPHTEFEKWAAVEVSTQAPIPDGLESLTVPEGLYATYIHHGPASTFQDVLQSFFTEWLPNSGYDIDSRAHFEILGPDYRPDDPHAEEEVWMPLIALPTH